MKTLISITFFLLFNVMRVHAERTDISILIRRPNSTPLEFTCGIEGKSLEIQVHRYVYLNDSNDFKIDLEWKIAMTLTSVPYDKFITLLREAPANVGRGGLDVPLYEVALTEKGVRKLFNFSESDDATKLPVIKEMIRVVNQLSDLSQIRPRKIFEFKSLEQ